MPTNRPFFASFWAAFRAHSNPTFKATSSPGSPGASAPDYGLPSSSHVTNPTTSTSTTTASNPRSISTKAASAFQQPQSQNTTTPNTSSSPTNNTTAPQSSISRSPNYHTPIAMSPPGASTPLSRGRQRRGSDSSSSSGGFKDILGAEKWYIGGRTASGEEKFYRLGLVTAGGVGSSGRRVRSLDRLSL